MAPLALALVLVASVVVVSNGASTGQRVEVDGNVTQTQRPKHTHRWYTVRAGDTLSAIQLRTGVEIQRLRDWNPTVDTFTLQPGQRLRLSAPPA